MKRSVLCDASFDATALAEFVEIQKRGADPLGAYGYYIKVVFLGKCEGRKTVFQQQELAQQTPNTNCPVLVDIPVKLLAGDEHSEHVSEILYLSHAVYHHLVSYFYFYFDIQFYVLRTSLCYTLRQMCSISVVADNAMVGYEVGSFLQLPLGKAQSVTMSLSLLL